MRTFNVLISYILFIKCHARDEFARKMATLQYAVPQHAACGMRVCPDVASCLRLNHLPNGFQRHQPDALSARWRSLYEANSDRDFTRDVTVDDRAHAGSLVAASAVAIDEISGLAV